MLCNCPPNLPAKSQVSTPQCTWFFEAFDHKDAGGKCSARDISHSFRINHTTGYNLLNDRQKYGGLVERRGMLRKHKNRRSRAQKAVANTSFLMQTSTNSYNPTAQPVHTGYKHK
jgi:hypothetical protein